MKNIPIRKLDKIMIQTERGTKWIHLTDVTRIREEPWLDRFGNWGSLLFKDGTIEYFCSPSFDTITKTVKILQQIEAARKQWKSSGKSTSEKQSAVTRNA